MPKAVTHNLYLPIALANTALSVTTTARVGLKVKAKGHNAVGVTSNGNDLSSFRSNPLSLVLSYPIGKEKERKDYLCSAFIL